MCFGNIKDAYRGYPKPPLWHSDHNTVHLVPHYKQRFKSSKPELRTIKKWSEESMECLKGCFDCTTWNTFTDTCRDLEELNSVVTDYIQFCVDCVIPEKNIKVFPNDKPWVNRELKEALKKKRRAFEQGDVSQMKAIQREIRQIVSDCKHKYKVKIEGKMRGNDLRQAW